MGRDPASVDADLVAQVRARSRPAAEAEVRAALAPLTPAEEKRLRSALLAPPPGPLGPFGWADVARGTEPAVAAAREISGYYALQAERDALAAMVGARPAQRPAAPPPGRKSRAVRSAKRAEISPRAQELLGLFAYHRDAPLVARSLGVSLAELTAELDALQIRRRAFALTRGSYLPAATAAPGPRGPPVRRRTLAQKPAPPPPLPDPRSELKALLAEIGPRREALAQRLGLSPAAVLARFRAAGLERELALRERDLIRALWSKHRASEARVAADLGVTPARLREIALERGLLRELDAIRDRFRREARAARWPRQRLEQVLHRGAELRELGLWEELNREVAARVGVIWKSLHGKPQALALLGKKLQIDREDAEKLRRLLDLR